MSQLNFPPPTQLVSANDIPNLRPTMRLKFLGGKLHQLWTNDEQSISVWRKVESE